MRLIILFFVCLLIGCDDKPLNYPYSANHDNGMVYYGSFEQRPNTLDPARSYASNEYQFLANIYEPPLQYDLLKRPYKLKPLTATQMPSAKYYDKNGKLLPDDAETKQIDKTVYTIDIKPGIFYQPHPALAKSPQGKYYYHDMRPERVARKAQLKDFSKSGTRELVADDYVYQIKRFASPRLNSPIFGLMSEYIIGLSDLREQIKKDFPRMIQSVQFVDLRKYPLSGVKAIGKYRYQISIKGKYPQFMYWLAMPFFSPMPWEAEKFHYQAGMSDKNITLDWYAIGTGPYMLTVNDPNSHMMLQRNPNFHEEYYPSHGEPNDTEQGYLNRAGEKLPFVDTFLFTLEKESIPRWNKFIQGYYDASGINSESFDQAVRIDSNGQAYLTSDMRERDIRLTTIIMPTVFYLAFNMLDDVVGGNSERARKLRQAIGIAIDEQEYISIFLNGRGLPAHSPIPPGIFGYQSGKAGIDPVRYNWRHGKLVGKPLSDAQRLLREAGYPDGRDKDTGKPLTLYYDAVSGGGPDERMNMKWMQKQLKKLGINLIIRATQYNRFQEKVQNGNVQLFPFGWHADYPDPENFLFLLYGPNAKVEYGGENAANYHNSEFDELFEQMKGMANGPKRQAIINKMLTILQHDSPWVPRFHPKAFHLSQTWLEPNKPMAISLNSLKYIKLDPNLRTEKQKQWNKPIWWPVISLVIVLVLSLVPAFTLYYRKVHKS